MKLLLALRDLGDKIDITWLAEDASHVYYADDTGTANAKSVVINPIPTIYKKGLAISFLNTVQNTGAATINVNGLGVKSLTNSKGSPLISGSLKPGLIYTLDITERLSINRVKGVNMEQRELHMF